MSPLGLKLGKKKGAAPAAATPVAAAPAASAPAASAAARGVKVEKPKANIYTVMLVLSFVAILVGCLCLYAEMSAYEFAFKARL